MYSERPLLMLVERFLRETGMPAATFGRRAMHDPRFVQDLRLGRQPRTAARCRVEHFMNIEREARQIR